MNLSSYQLQKKRGVWTFLLGNGETVCAALQSHTDLKLINVSAGYRLSLIIIFPALWTT